MAHCVRRELPTSTAKYAGSVIIACLFLLWGFAAHGQISANVAQADLNYLVDSAGTIVRGNVASVVFEPHPQFPNLQTVVVTIAVAKTLKGRAGTTLTFRQFVGGTKEYAGESNYRKTEELLLFLNKESAYGLTSPVGMEQGLFRVVRDEKGNRYAVNGRGNAGLFNQVLAMSATRGVTFSPQARTMLSQGSGQVALGTFEETIQSLVAAQ